jgi:hypothetical protein
MTKDSNYALLRLGIGILTTHYPQILFKIGHCVVFEMR